MINSKLTDIQIIKCQVAFIPVKFRLPLKFGAETIETITCARVEMTVKNQRGNIASGLGETPLSVGWGWPSQSLTFKEREEQMLDFCRKLEKSWSDFAVSGHAMEIGNAFNLNELEHVDPTIPQLAQLICSSPFDLALHDAYGNVNHIDTYSTYNAGFMNHDLAFYFQDAEFNGKYPEDYFRKTLPDELRVWHLVGGKDLLDKSELKGDEIQDGYPVILTDWIEQDNLKCLKIKLTGSDAEKDYERMKNVGEIAVKYHIDYLSPDFNCLVKTPQYVCDILDRLMVESPEIYGKILYVEQPFPYDLTANKIDVHSVSSRKPLFMDESAHDWQLVKLGFELGWTGVALKVCKTQTGALLSGCWACEHGMTLMVQDLTNPMLSVIPHVQLARHLPTIMGVECNAPQFYPEASKAFAAQHPFLYKRRNGVVNLSTLSNIGLSCKS